MSGFVALAANSDPAADALEGDGWWPDLSIAHFRGEMRVTATVADARVRAALIGGYLSAEAELARWRAGHEAAGVARLEALALPTIAGEPRALLLWRRVVYSYAIADLAETHGDITATDKGRDEVQERALSADDHRRNATAAVRDLLGRRRARTSLL